MFEVAELGHTVDKDEFKRRRDELRVELVNAQYDLRHQGDFPVMVVLAGDDRLGVDDVIGLLNEWMDARYLETHVMHAPSDEELERPRFWRFWRRLPRRGAISLSSGGLSSEVLRPRLMEETDDEEMLRRCERVVRFERELVADGAVFVKIWLHLPKGELKRKLEAAKDDPALSWRLQPEDHLLVERRKEAIAVAERFLRATDSAEAPWHLVEATDHRYRDLAVATLILEALTARLAGGRPPETPPTPPVGLGPEVDGAATVLDKVDLTRSLDKGEYKDRLTDAQRRLNAAHRAARAEGITTVLAFEGWDAAGKGGAIRRLTRALDAGHFRIAPIAAPTEEELAHHYLWRFWQRLPRAGAVQIFDRSWYGRVLVERVEGLATNGEWRRAYGEINDFEEQLTDHGVVVAKFWLHISSEEQLRRFEARQDTPFKQYKITDEDWRNREHWHDYELAVHDMVERTSTPSAPWHLVAAEDKRWARVQVVETVADALERALDG